MNKTKLLILALCAIVLTGCDYPEKEGRIKTDNQPDKSANYEVTYLFEVDGIKVYRFNDRGYYIYFTNTAGKTSYDYNIGGKTPKHIHIESINTIDSITHDPDCQCREEGGEK